MTDLNAMGRRARTAARALARVSTEQKNAALEAIASTLIEHAGEILEANAIDVERGRDAGLSAALLDRMLLTEARLQGIASDVRNVARLPDPVGEIYEQQTLPNGLQLHKRRTPFGVVGVIYEARPNVTVDVATLCLKSGNAVILRGGKEIMRSCAALTGVIRQVLEEHGIPAAAVQAIDNPDRALMEQLLRLDTYVDLIIPRGGMALHQFCRDRATVPVVTGGIGVCHIYVDKDAKLDTVVPIVHNAKVQRPSVCNALDTLLVDRAIAAQILPAVAVDLLASQVELRVDEETLQLLRAAGVTSERVVLAQPGDFGIEFLALILSVRIVDGLDAALDHIAEFGSSHSDAILTEHSATAQRFVEDVDSAVVFVNASTRFNDGAQMGMGAEIAISTQKMHVRGPMALRELTTYKWVIEGAGHVRS